MDTLDGAEATPSPQLSTRHTPARSRSCLARALGPEAAAWAPGWVLISGGRDQVPHLWLTARPPEVGGGACHGAAAGRDRDEAAARMRAHDALLVVTVLPGCQTLSWPAQRHPPEDAASECPEPGHKSSDEPRGLRGRGSGLERERGCRDTCCDHKVPVGRQRSEHPGHGSGSQPARGPCRPSAGEGATPQRRQEASGSPKDKELDSPQKPPGETLPCWPVLDP